MTITALTILELITPYDFHHPPLSNTLAAFIAQQCQFSAYPVNLYRDTTSMSQFYLITGWHNNAALSLWKEHIVSSRPMDTFFTAKEEIYLDMNFDTIPKSGQGIMCIAKHTMQTDDAGSEGEEDIGAARPQSTSQRVLWMGGGVGCHEERVFYQFVLYADGTSEEAIRRCHQSRKSFVMRRISIPRPQVVPVSINPSPILASET